jgi:GrpB-like predicted nucleotidyltransferase (UPF0157 family)
MSTEKNTEVILVPHDSKWAHQFKRESASIQQLLGDTCCQLHHIGSTAIAGIYAKPVIDILIEVSSLEGIDDYNSSFQKQGYSCEGEHGIPGRRYYWKDTDDRRYHIHLFQQGNEEIARHLAFRDYLKKHHDTAQGYSWIKRCLAEQFPNDIAAYVSAKDSFIRMIDHRAGKPRQDQLIAPDGILIEEYNVNWPKLALAEMNAIRRSIQLPYVAIEHLGSTSVIGLSAKATIDIFLAIDDIQTADQWIKPLEALGYDYWADNPNKKHLRYFKGMPPFGVGRTHHLHIMPFSDKFKRRVAFRDALQQDDAIRQQYQTLKHQLAQQHPGDRERYTDAKGEFIAKVLGG